MKNTWLVAGLGNPGPRYAGTRHNAGRATVAELARREGLRFSVHKAQALVAEGAPGADGRFVFAQPNTFMNSSGGPLAQLMRFYDVSPDRLIVVHDDLDLPFGTLRLKFGGGHGGHNGVRDIIARLGTPEFTRVRIGIGRPGTDGAVIDFVLQRFTAVQRRQVDQVFADAADAVEM
ncbi:MAG TPA: aminoacyl-tRNA hydrolase, partial [Microbacteriaceae bacterium]|nr:aminoacyl-tRNA hydrolase [Microbacteriaceae bacterium]